MFLPFIKKILGISFSFSIFICLSVTNISAQACEDRQCNSSNKEENKQCVQEKIACLEGRLREEQGKKATLTSAISVLNGQISIQQLQIQQTMNEINQLETQITDLSNRIEGLNVSLDRLTAIMMERVRDQYKKTKISPFTMMAKASSFNDLVSQHKYVSAASQQTVEAMERAETQKQEYDEQKNLKEVKQKEVETKRSQLQGQQNQLTSQKQEQERFLQQTQNNEKRFQELLDQANRQLAAFGRFVAVQGGATILTNQTKCDDWGCYYSQRDSQWGTMGIGRSSSSMAEFGCLVTSMAMIASHYDKSLNPGMIASSSNPFYYTTAFMIQGSWTVNGVTMSRTRIGSSTSKIDEELAAGRPVVVGIGAGPDHFLVIKEKKDGKYIMHDPFMPNGHNVPFTDKYSLGSISAVDRVTVN